MIINKNRTFEELTEVEKMVLSIKAAIEQIKVNPDMEEFFGIFIAKTMQELKSRGMSKEEIFSMKIK